MKIEFIIHSAEEHGAKSVELFADRKGIEVTIGELHSDQFDCVELGFHEARMVAHNILLLCQEHDPEPVEEA